MSRLLTLTLIILISACGQQTEKKTQLKSDSVQKNSDSTASKNINAQKTRIEPNENETQKKDSELKFTNGPSREKLELKGKTVFIIQLDSFEIEQLKRIDGEDNFYIAADDLMWYNSMMLEKMDSLRIPVKYTDKDTVDFYSKNYKRTIVKDSTFSLYTYFLFDGKEIKRTELFELIEE
jgi:hypothetical protein